MKQLVHNFVDLGNVVVNVLNGRLISVSVGTTTYTSFDSIPELILKSVDPEADSKLADILIWLDTEINDGGEAVLDDPGSSGDPGDLSTSYPDGYKDTQAPVDRMDYLGMFEESLWKAKNSTSECGVLAMAGHQPVMVIKFPGDTPLFGICFPPETRIFSPMEVAELSRTGHYSIGKRYMDKIVEVFGVC